MHLRHLAYNTFDIPETSQYELCQCSHDLSQPLCRTSLGCRHTSLAMSNEAFKCNQHCMSITTIRYRPLIGQVTVASPHFGGRGNSRRLRLGTFVSLHHVYCAPSTASWVRGKEQKRCRWDDINKVSKGHESRKEVFTCSYRENKNFV